jgi:hypothetical protein
VKRSAAIAAIAHSEALPKAMATQKGNKQTARGRGVNLVNSRYKPAGRSNPVPKSEPKNNKI